MDIRAYYGLTKIPFVKGTELKNLFETQDRKEVTGRLGYLMNAKGVGVVTGNPGTGKTSIVREYVKNMNPSLYKTVYVKMTSVSSSEFFRQIAYGLGLDPAYRKADVFKQVQEEITYLAKDKRCLPVIIVDECQLLKQEILRDLVLLMNYEMDSRDNCIVVLLGLGALNGMLNKAINEALKQRIIVNYHMDGLRYDEISSYIKHVLKECGSEDPIFTEGAIEAAYGNCQGSVRKLNRILHLAMQEGMNRDVQQIDAEIVKTAWEEMDLS